MSNAVEIVDDLIENDASVNAKQLIHQVSAEEDALKASGNVSPHTVKQYQTIWHRTVKNKDRFGSAAHVKVTSVKTWARRPGYFEIKWKRGLREYGTINPTDAPDWTTIEPPPLKQRYEFEPLA